ncbi:MAG: PAS domain-containing protein [Acidaminococcaceae bacterium]|nr:PAS domain-containing protein [Acidaminococcaceae bacterium]
MDDGCAAGGLGLWEKQSYEYRSLRKDGDTCWIIGSAEYVRNIDDELVIQSVFIDVDSKKKTELLNLELIEQERGSQELLRQILEGTKIFYFYYYPQKKLEVIPLRTSSYFNCAAEYYNMPESFAEDFIAPETQKEFYEMYAAIDNGAKTSAAVLCDKSGQYWMRVTLTVMSYDEAGKPKFVIGIIEDINEQKDMELEKIELQSIYNFTVEQDYDAVCICDLPNSAYVMRFASHFNGQPLPLQGCITEQLPVFIERFVHEEDRQKLLVGGLEQFLIRLEQENAVMFYFRSSVQTGARHKEVKISYFDGIKDKILVTMRDIHERTMQEEDDKQIISDAYQLALQANQAKSDFFRRCRMTLERQ